MAQMCVGQPGTPTNVAWKGGLVRNLPDRDQQGGRGNIEGNGEHELMGFAASASRLRRLACIVAHFFPQSNVRFWPDAAAQMLWGLLLRRDSARPTENGP